MDGSTYARSKAGAPDGPSAETGSRCEVLWLAGKGLAGESLRALVRELLGDEAGRPLGEIERLQQLAPGLL